MSVNFDQSRLDLISRLEERHFWFISRRLFVKQINKKFLSVRHGPILDLGCGTGSIAKMFAKNGFCVVGVDWYSEGFRSSDKNVLFARADGCHLPFKKTIFGCVLMLDFL